MHVRGLTKTALIYSPAAIQKALKDAALNMLGSVLTELASYLEQFPPRAVVVVCTGVRCLSELQLRVCEVEVEGQEVRDQ
jgi:hypothetical protein